MVRVFQVALDVRNSPASVGGKGWIPDPGGSHAPGSSRQSFHHNC